MLYENIDINKAGSTMFCVVKYYNALNVKLYTREIEGDSWLWNVSDKRKIAYILFDVFNEEEFKHKFIRKSA